MLSYYHFRKISPSSRQVSSDEATKLNMRKLHVNAQITATISIIESIITITYTIIVALTVRTSFGTLINIMILYMIIVPYSFLMNTSDNKERIIEIGWMNVVKNIFGSFFNPRGSDDPIPTISNDIEMKTTNTERKLDKGQKKETFNITSSNHEKDKNASTTFSKLEVVYDEQPSTSGLLKSKITRKEKYQTNSYQLISKMLTCIEVEEQYIKYFRAYLSYREAYNEEKSDLDLDMPPIDDKKDEYGLITSKSKRKGFQKIRLSSSTEKISNSINRIRSTGKRKKSPGGSSLLRCSSPTRTRDELGVVLG